MPSSSWYFVVDSLLFTCSSIDLILERLCLEGSRRQAKYAVHALAAITKDDGLKSLSVLYKVCFSFGCGNIDAITFFYEDINTLSCITSRS